MELLLLELIKDGTGTWISPKIKAYAFQGLRGLMTQVNWNGNGAAIIGGISCHQEHGPNGI